MSLPVETLEPLLRLQAAKIAELEAAGVSRSVAVTVESAIETEVRRAFAGEPHRLHDPAFVASLVERPAPTAAEAAWMASALPPAAG